MSSMTVRISSMSLGLSVHGTGDIEAQKRYGLDSLTHIANAVALMQRCRW